MFVLFLHMFCLFSGVYFYTERIKVFTPLLERKELISRLATLLRWSKSKRRHGRQGEGQRKSDNEREKRKRRDVEVKTRLTCLIGR